MKKLFFLLLLIGLAILFSILFAHLISLAQDEDVLVADTVGTSRIVLPPLPSASPIEPKSTKIEWTPTKPTEEQKAKQGFTPLPTTTTPREIGQPESAEQRFNQLPSVTTPQEIQKPEEAGQKFKDLSPVSIPQEVTQPQISKQNFNQLPPVSSPQEVGQPTQAKQDFNDLPAMPTPQKQTIPSSPFQKFDPLPSTSTPQETSQPGQAGQKFNTLPSIPTPQEKQGETPSSNINLNPLPEVSTPAIIHKEGNPGWENTRIAFNTLPSVGTPQSVYQVASLSDWSGGLNTRDFPTEIGNNEFVELQNFVWQGKKIKPRWGFTKYNTTEFDASDKIFGLYRYYKQDGTKILVAGINTIVYADTTTAGSGTFVSVKTELMSNSKFYSFETFKDKCIVTHSGNYPFWYDKTTTGYIGLADSGRGGLVVSEDEDSSNCCSFILTGDTKITIEPMPTRPDQKGRYRRSDTLITIYDRRNTKIYDVDRWAGYTLCFVDTLGNPYWYYITSNILDTIYLEGQNCPTTQWSGNYYIYSYFDYEGWGGIGRPLYVNATPGNYCQDSLVFIHGTSWNGLHDYVDSAMVIRMVTGFSAGQERFLGDCPGVYDTLVVISAKFDSIIGGDKDSAKVYRKRFWKPSLVKVFKTRLFFANMTGYPNLVVFSDYNRLGDFPPDNYFVVKTDDGDYITALACLYDDQLGYKNPSNDFLGIFKNNSIYKLVFNTDIDYHLEQVIEGVGCVAPNTVTNIEGKYLIFLHTSGVYAFDGRTVTSISDKIPDIVLKFNNPNIGIACGGYYDKHYYLSYCDSTVAVNNRTIVFNTETGVWSKATFTAGLFAQQNAITDSVKLLFTHPGAKSYIYNFGKATTDTGVAIPLLLKSKSFDFGNISTYKRIVDFDMAYYLSADSVNLALYTDFGDSLRYSTKTTTYGGNRYSRMALDKTCVGQNISFKLTSSKLFELGNVTFKLKEIGE